MTEQITDFTFDERVLRADEPVLVYFWATWCPPCRALSPLLDAIGAERDDIRIVKINADDNPRAVAEYRVTSVPTMKVFRGGEVLTTIQGAKPRPALEAVLAGVL